jgi:hypothetical protein
MKLGMESQTFPGNRRTGLHVRDTILICGFHIFK